MADETTVINAQDGAAVAEVTENVKENTGALSENAAKIEEVRQNWISLGTAQNDTGRNINQLNGAFSAFGNVMSSVGAPIKNLLTGMQGVTDITNQQASAFGLGGTFLLGYREKVEAVAKTINSNPINGFTNQISSLNGVISGNNSLGVFASMLEKVGVPASKIKEELNKGIPSFTNYATNVLKSADAMFHMRDSQLALAASSGGIANFWQNAGPNLENLNNALQEHETVLTNVGSRTGLTVDQIRPFYSEFGKIPGAMRQMTNEVDGSGQKMNMFSGLLLQAQANGRNFNTVIAEAAELFSNYGITGDAALTAIGRISEVSEKAGIPIDALQKSISSTSGQFMGLANAGEAAGKQFDALAGNINRYYDTLMKTGMSSNNALSAINQMTSAVSKLTMAQKAFLSQQSGGPGGLMGGFQIEKMLMQGDTAGVFDKMREALMKQMGPIVGMDEATSSQEGANQMQKQIMMLQNGPLGDFAKTTEDAIRLSQALKDNDSSFIESNGLSKNIASEQISRGDMLRENTRTPMTDWQNMLQSITMKVDFANADTMQRALIQRPGTSYETTESSKVMRENMERSKVVYDMPTNTNQNIAASAAPSSNLIADLFPNLKGMASGFAANISSTAGKEIPTESAPVQMARAPRGRITAEQISAQNTPEANTTSNRVVPPTTQQLDVRVEGICIDCGKKGEVSQHMHAMSPQAAAANRK